MIAERILEINTYSHNRSSINYLRVLFDLYRLLKQAEEGGDLSYSELAHQLEETYRGFLPFPASLYRIERSTSEFFAFARAQFSPALPENATFEEIYSYANKQYANMIEELL